MTERFGRTRDLARPARLVGALALLAVVAVACGGPTPPETPASAGGSGTVSGSQAASPAGAPRPLTGLRLPAGIQPGGLDADRFVFADRQGVAVLSLGTSHVLRLPAPPRGLVFRPTAIAGNLVIGDVAGARADPRVVEAMAFDIASSTWSDIAASLPAGDSSSALATDAVSVVGMDLGPPGGKGPQRAYVFDIASGTVTFLPSLPGGGVAVPAGIGDGHIVGFAGASDRGGGWLWDQAAGSYTSLASASGSDRASALAVAGDTVVGVLNGATPSADSPFAYDIPTKTFTDLKLPGSRGRDVSGSLVLTSTETGWNGTLRDLGTGAEVTFDKVVVGGVVMGVRPWAMSDGWVIALTPPTVSGAGFGEVVAIPIGGQP